MLPAKETTMEKILAWNAKRAGGRITVYGTGEDGAPRRVPHIDEIRPIDGKVVAVASNATLYELAV
jgi:hypothetical protein